MIKPVSYAFPKPYTMVEEEIADAFMEAFSQFCKQQKENPKIKWESEEKTFKHKIFTELRLTISLKEKRMGLFWKEKTGVKIMLSLKEGKTYSMVSYRIRIPSKDDSYYDILCFGKNSFRSLFKTVLVERFKKKSEPKFDEEIEN